MAKAGSAVSTVLIFVCSLGVVLGGLYYYMHKDDHVQVARPNELAPLRTCRGIEASTLFGDYAWKKYTPIKGYCFYLQPELGCLISLQLAPNGRVTVFRLNSVTKELTIEQRLQILWFACDFIYGNEACAYQPIVKQFADEVVHRVVLFNTNKISVMDVQVGFFQSGEGPPTGIECRTKYARPWHGAVAVNKLINEFNKNSAGKQKLVVPPSVVPGRLRFPRQTSPSKELAESAEGIYWRYQTAVLSFDAAGSKLAIAQMEALGQTEKAEKMQEVYEEIRRRFPKHWKD